MTYFADGWNIPVLYYDLLNQDGRAVAQYSVVLEVSPNPLDRPISRCIQREGDYSLSRCTAGGSDVTFANRYETKINVARGEAQAATLTGFCATTGSVNAAECTFEPTRAEFLSGARREKHGALPQPLFSVDDNSNRALTQTTDATETVAWRDGLGIALKPHFKLWNAAEMGIKMSPGGKWYPEHTFRYPVEVTVRPHHQMRVEAIWPMIVYTGTFKIRLGNTIWIVRGVSFSVPWPHGTPVFLHRVRPIGA